MRIYARRLADGEIASLAKSALSAVVAAPPEKRSEADLNALYDWWLTSLDEAYQELSQTHESLVREQADMQARSTIAHVMQEKDEAAIAFILNRGEYDQRRDQVAPGTPKMLPPFPDDAPRNRLGFAKWLLRPDHPLTARVTVNRFWSEVFGTGLVKTAGDFGVSGELPSHPELLDWLAVEFRESGWDVKRLFKLIVTSAAYRQSCGRHAGETGEGSGQSAALARPAVPHGCRDGPRLRARRQRPAVGEDRRAEREAVSAARRVGSGGDDRQQHARLQAGLGRGALSPQHVHVLEAGRPAGVDGRVQRAEPRNIASMVRERTNTPLQALVTLNDPQFVEAARRLAERAIKASNGRRCDGIDFLAERLLARRLRPEEIAIVQASLEKFQQHYAAAARTPRS